MEELRYPIGRFEPSDAYSAIEVAGMIASIEAAPARLAEALRGLGEAELETPYRPGGWTIRQVAHHLPDSHLNGYVRMKLALTEDGPTIRTYEEEAEWAELPDAATAPVEVALRLLEALHRRWSLMLRSLGEAELARGFLYPGSKEPMRLDAAIALYAWHGEHHVAHVTGAREKEGLG